MIPVEEKTQELIKVWLSAQVTLPQVIRWSKYVNRGNVRTQNTLQHTHSIVTLGTIMIPDLHPDLDELLLLKALHFHDEGEGLVGIDTHYIDKTTMGDVNEYRAFVNHYKELPQSVFSKLEEAFLLQFASKDLEEFPVGARSVMLKLRKNKSLEILAFEAIERFDYHLYATEQFVHYDNLIIFLQTVRNQIHHLDRLLGQLPGFANFWTPGLQIATREILANYEGHYLEQKGEK